MLALLSLLALPAHAQNMPTVQVHPGISHEMVERSARYLPSPPGGATDFEEARAAYQAGTFVPEFPASGTGSDPDQRIWLALPFQGAATGAPTASPMRRIIGIGGIFETLPSVHLDCEGSQPREILASQTRDGGPLSARYFTYIRTQSFDLSPGQACVAFVNLSSADHPNLGIFREGELGTRQVIAVLLKGGVTTTLLIIGAILAIVAYLGARPMGVLMGISYSMVMLQNEMSLFGSIFSQDPMQSREVWENTTLITIFLLLHVFLYGFRKDLRLENTAVRMIASLALIAPAIALARSTNSTPEFIWVYYLALFLSAIAVTFRLDVSRGLRWTAGAILFLGGIGAIAVDPSVGGGHLSDLTIEWYRDLFRLVTGVGLLVLLMMDVVTSRREREQLVAERIEALQTKAQTSERLLETEREYARARDAASRTKAQLLATSHDIRQPIVGLRAALAQESDHISPPLQEKLLQAINYLERLTREYDDHDPADRERSSDADELGAERDEGAYSLELVAEAVRDMFKAEADAAGVQLTIKAAQCQTHIPALALVRATSNLVANALRHADATKITIEVKAAGGAAPSAGSASLIVSDDGRGMDAALLARALQAGVRSDTSDGDGLGLAIIDGLAKRHGFAFTLESAPSKGTQGTLANL